MTTTANKEAGAEGASGNARRVQIPPVPKGGSGAQRGSLKN
uniref:Uncharacterized protein n=1 Tax=Siphoviridae sp. ct8aS59 TaxID=2825365 RepID=A0A8S5TSY0_9CAUD|nr:MAG TPA: hypothetical protein [Siphoviridae sp. ct8aS59]